MFPIGNAAELTNAQLWLLHWLQVYDWAFSLPDGERPTNQVIEDDERFDDWLKQYQAKRMREMRQSSTGASRGANKHNQVINF